MPGCGTSIRARTPTPAGSVARSAKSAAGTSSARASKRDASDRIPGRARQSSVDDEHLGRAKPIGMNANQVLAFQHALPRSASIARRSDEARDLAKPRILARGDPMHGDERMPEAAGTSARSALSAGARPARRASPPCQVPSSRLPAPAATEKTPRPGWIMPSSERARSSIASYPVFRSRTSASSALVARLQRRVRGRAAPLTWRSNSRTCSHPPLPSHIGYCRATISATKATARMRTAVGAIAT